MLNSIKTSVTSFLSAPYAVFVSPNNIFVRGSNGSVTSPSVHSDITSGVGPFEYEWTSDNSDIAINSPTSDKTTLSTNGYNRDVSGIITLKVKDTGNANAEVSTTANANFILGTIL